MKTPKEAKPRASARVPRDGKAAKAVKAIKPKAPARRKAPMMSRARLRAPRPIARLLRSADPRAALEALIETKGVVKAVEGTSLDLRPPGQRRERFGVAKIPHVLDIPDLIELQRESFNWFITEGLREAFASISPIKDFTGNLILEFGEHSLGDPKYTVEECRERDRPIARRCACACASSRPNRVRSKAFPTKRSS